MAPAEETNVTKPTGELRPDEKLNYEEDVKCSGSSSTTVGKTAYDTDDISQSQAAELQDLARQLSRASRQGGLDVENEPQQVINPFLDSESDPELNPDSKSFNVAKWLKTILQITSRDPERFPKRTAGVSFRNMNVHGYGTAADYQSDVGNLPLKAWSGIMSMLGLRKKVRIDILRDFEGLVKSGEMLVVLGRPGRYAYFIAIRLLALVDIHIAVVQPFFGHYRVKLTASTLTKATISSIRVSPGSRCTRTSGEKSSTRLKLKLISPR